MARRRLQSLRHDDISGLSTFPKLAGDILHSSPYDGAMRWHDGCERVRRGGWRPVEVFRSVGIVHVKKGRWIIKVGVLVANGFQDSEYFLPKIEIETKIVSEARKLPTP
jgi:hypothetical protein